MPNIGIKEGFKLMNTPKVKSPLTLFLLMHGLIITTFHRSDYNKKFSHLAYDSNEKLNHFPLQFVTVKSREIRACFVYINIRERVLVIKPLANKGNCFERWYNYFRY